MQMWCHLPAGFRRGRLLQLVVLVTTVVALITTLFFAHPSFAAPGVNQTISFQGRLSSSSGAVVPDGYYNMQFKIYQDGDGTTAGDTSGSPAGTLKWTESYVNNGGTSGVKVRNGIFSVTLGSQTPFGTSVDWNQDTLWLSMNVAGSAAACTTFGTAPCTADGEMLPMRRITATPFALNAGQVGGLTAGDLIHNQNSIQQTSSNFWISGTGRADTALQAPAFDTATAANLSIGTTNASGITIGHTGATTSIQGTLQANNLDATSATALAIGSSNATAINLNQNVTVASGKSLTLAGGNTASRPSSPTKGMLYFDTSTNQLLQYNGTKWVGSQKQAVLIAANDSTQSNKDAADYTASASNAQTTINTAIGALPSTGGTVYLLPGTYNFGGALTISKDNVTLTGSLGAVVNRAFNGSTFSNNGLLMISGSSVTISNLSFEGNSGTYTNNTYNSGVVISNGQDQTIANNYVEGMAVGGIITQGGGAGQGAHITGNTLSDNGIGIWTDAAWGAVISGNTVEYSTSTDVERGAIMPGNGQVSVTNNTLSDNEGNGIYGGSDSTIDGNQVHNNGGIGITVSDNSTVSNNRVNSNGAGINIDKVSGFTVTGNTITENATFGISGTGNDGLGGLIDSNIIKWNGQDGIIMDNDVDDLTISSNYIDDNGDTGSYSGVFLSTFGTTAGLKIVNNSITDTAGTGYAINIDAGANIYLSGNSYSGTGASSIRDNGSHTIYAGQLDSNGTLINKSEKGSSVQTATNTADAFTVQNAAGVSALSVDTTNNSVLIAGKLDTTTAATLNIGSTNATSITIGKTGSNTTTTVLGNAVFKPVTGSDSTTAFQIQRANSTVMFAADTTNQTITLGDPASANKTVISTATGQITKYGTARNTKKITLNAEYVGSVLDSGTGSNNSGTMTSSVDLTNRMNYYKWTSTQSTNQTYDVVVQIPIPSDFDGWASSNPLDISTYASSTSNGAVTLEARDSTGTVRCDFVTVTPGSTSTWATNNSACTLGSGTYTPGDYITLRIRMQSKNSADVRIGNINLNYLSKY